MISNERLLTDKDFRRIDVALAKQDVTYVKRGAKRPHNQIETSQGGELVKLSDIENVYKKRKHDKAARQKSVKVRINDCISIRSKEWNSLGTIEFAEGAGGTRQIRL